MVKACSQNFALVLAFRRHVVAGFHNNAIVFASWVASAWNLDKERIDPPLAALS